MGTTFTHNGDYRNDVPAIASRNLHNLDLVEDTFADKSKLSIDRKFQDRFIVNYIYGFNSTQHVYFVTVQKKSHLHGEEEKGYVTRLARVCVTDNNYDTYTEVSMQFYFYSTSFPGEQHYHYHSPKILVRRFFLTVSYNFQA